MVRIKLNQQEIFDGRVEYPFYKGGKPLVHSSTENNPLWGMTLLESGSMRFRWNEKNPNREAVLDKICSRQHGKNFAPLAVEQDHTKIVYDIKKAEEAEGLVGDGLITDNRELVPVVTIADCVPICLYDSETGVFGAVHSGWKGTGIIEEWMHIARENYGTKPENVCVAIGAHIHDCCYVVNQERAEYFRKNFCKECVFPVKPGEPLCKGANINWDNGSGPVFRLSLFKANLSLAEKLGIPEDNIVVLDECTCCNTFFGSNRRETSNYKGDPEAAIKFTVGAAFVRW